MHLRENENQAFNVEESDQLARTLLAFSKLLPEETPQPWPRYCGAMGMCYGYSPNLPETLSFSSRSIHQVKK